jgi:hypothetical protein
MQGGVRRRVTCLLNIVIYCRIFRFTDISSFQAFFNYIDMRALLQNFCVYHVNAPGQEEGATTLPDEWVATAYWEIRIKEEHNLQIIICNSGVHANYTDGKKISYENFSQEKKIVTEPNKEQSCDWWHSPMASEWATVQT